MFFFFLVVAFLWGLVVFLWWCGGVFVFLWWCFLCWCGGVFCAGIKILLPLFISILTSNISFIQLFSMLLGYPVPSYLALAALLSGIVVTMSYLPICSQLLWVLYFAPATQNARCENNILYETFSNFNTVTSASIISCAFF